LQSATVRTLVAKCIACQALKNVDNELLTGGQNMKTREFLLECKIKLDIKTDYKLAQRLEITRANISFYMSGKRKPDLYATTRIALCLGRDPAMIAAEIEAEGEKNSQKAEFWKGFLLHASRAKKLMLAGICGGILLAGGNAPKAEAAMLESSHNVALRQKQRRKTAQHLTFS
jgi:transcriptional regulator with XRE-family HTH domain